MVTTITIEREDDWFVITDEETGVTTQGETKLESLLMLADALVGYEDADEDLLAMALDVFVPEPEAEELVAELRGDEYEPPKVSEEQIRSNVRLRYGWRNPTGLRTTPTWIISRRFIRFSTTKFSISKARCYPIYSKLPRSESLQLSGMTELLLDSVYRPP